MHASQPAAHIVNTSSARLAAMALNSDSTLERDGWPAVDRPGLLKILRIRQLSRILKMVMNLKNEICYRENCREDGNI